MNAVGDVGRRRRTPDRGLVQPAKAQRRFPTPQAFVGEATTLVALATDAQCTKAECFLLAQSGHVGLGHAIRPSHTRHDGDSVVALATGAGSSRNLDRLRVAAAEVVAEAIRVAVRHNDAS